jgi:hypothetical protein
VEALYAVAEVAGDVSENSKVFAACFLSSDGLCIADVPIEGKAHDGREAKGSVGMEELGRVLVGLVV